MTAATLSVTPADELLTSAAVSSEYGIAQPTLKAWRARGDGPAWQPLGERRVVYRRSVLDAFVESEAHRGGRFAR